ncbi:hypothetical protein BDD12DRAFT_883495 [Trichophaea hybrida]|nr:hypothetical protein BDD12DRAFT_883495 [Trichophaea hybrida]
METCSDGSPTGVCGELPFDDALPSPPLPVAMLNGLIRESDGSRADILQRLQEHLSENTIKHRTGSIGQKGKNYAEPIPTSIIADAAKRPAAIAFSVAIRADVVKYLEYISSDYTIVPAIESKAACQRCLSHFSSVEVSRNLHIDFAQIQSVSSSSFVTKTNWVRINLNALFEGRPVLTIEKENGQNC